MNQKAGIGYGQDEDDSDHEDDLNYNQVSFVKTLDSFKQLLKVKNIQPLNLLSFNTKWKSGQYYNINDFWFLENITPTSTSNAIHINDCFSAWLQQESPPPSP